jgi:peptidoglycan hydrolase CwlO-like protein
MTIARTMSNLREAKKALKVAQSKIDLLDEQVDNILESVPHTLKDILADFNNFCNNSQ